MEWSPAEPNSLECIQIVYKVVERCNINCTYCYYFNMGDVSAMSRPARTSVETTRQLALWLVQGCKELRIPSVSIAFHGGEPMLLRPDIFSEMCQILVDEISPVAELRLSIQTNGTILNDEWLSAFHKYDVAVGVSIDGAREDHDRYRLDHKGRSSFDKTQKTINTLVEAANGNKAQLPSTISVVDHHIDYHNTYKYFRELGIERMHFLLPDRNSDDVEFRQSKQAHQIGNNLLDLFSAWLREDNPEIRIRLVDETLRHFQVGMDPGPVTRRRKDVQILIVRSDGTAAIDDSYIPALEWYETSPAFPIGEMTVRDVLSDPIFQHIERENTLIPDACQSCRWNQVCRGGDLENRFSSKTGFNNPSIYCESYKQFYPGVCELLESNGYPTEEIERKFSHG